MSKHLKRRMGYGLWTMDSGRRAWSGIWLCISDCWSLELSYTRTPGRLRRERTTACALFAYFTKGDSGDH